MQEWEEGPYADQKLARERYERDTRRVRRALREHFRPRRLAADTAKEAAASRALGWVVGAISNLF